jgi:antirestriction protein ArdC
VRKGEKSSLVVFYKEYERDPDPERDDDDDGTKQLRCARRGVAINLSTIEHP